MQYIPLASAGPEYNFAAAVAMFAGYLKESRFLKNINADSILALAVPHKQAHNAAQEEFIQLVERADKIYHPGKKKKDKKKKQRV
jgi:Ca-activated chloride channel homolog